MVSATARKAIQEGLRLAIPDGSLSISKWAEQYRYVDRGARPGKWSNDTVPFLTEIMDAVTEPDVREIVFMKSSQVGGSELAVNIVAYYMHIDPTQIVYCAEKEDKAKAWTQEAFDSTIRKTEVLRRLVRTADEDNNQRVKRFPGGQLTVVWATSPAELSSRPVQVLIFDECDAYKPTNEGDAIKLGEARTKTYSGSEKIVKISSPRNADTSEIEKSYLKGDRREYYVPCPSCDEMQTLKWERVKWDDGDAESAYMICEKCGVVIEDDDKYDMLAQGKWIAGADFNGTASFKINQLYSPFVPWSRMVIDFLEAKKFKSTLQVWTNTALGESWKPKERIEYADLELNREDYGAPVPQGVLVLTAGVDVQGNRLECEIVGWGRDHESWSIDYRVFDGDPGGLEVWDELSDFLTSEFEGETGVFRVKTAFIDSGYHTNMVARFCNANAGRKWFACKGMGEPGKPLIAKNTWAGKNPKYRLFPVGTNAAKDEIFSFLQVAEPGPGFCHFPATPVYDDAYLKQLCAETKVPRFRMGREYHVYEKVSANVRNEALDCFDDKTEVLTNSGWRKFADLTPYHQLATVNLDTDEIEYQTPTHTIVRPYSGSMVHLKSRRLDILVTPNHRMVTYRKEMVNRKWNFDVKPQITLAKDLTIHHQLKLTGEWKGRGPSSHHIPACISDQGRLIDEAKDISMTDWAAFLGWFVSEGNVFAGRSKTQGNMRYRVEISQNLGDKFDRIVDLLDRLPFRFRVQNGKGICKKLICSSKQLYLAVKECGEKVDVKRVPEYIKDASADAIAAFLDAAIAGDGWIQTKPGQKLHRTYATVSPQLANDIQELFIKIGCAANIKRREAKPYKAFNGGPGGDNTRPQYHISECKVPKASLDGGGDGKREFLGKTIQYDGMVYCATVPNGTLICRREGKSFIAGNCRVYATAARAKLNPNYEKIAGYKLKHAEAADREPEQIDGSVNPAEVDPTPKPTKPRVLPFRMRRNPFEGYKP